jgi:hypothetical protein
VAPKSIKGGEHLLDGPAQLGLEQLADRLRRGRGDLVLEPAQLGHHPGREQVGAGRQHLAELDEHAAAFLQGLAQTPGGRCGRGCGLLAGRLAQAQERPEAVLDGDPGDLGVAGQAAAGAADGPQRVGDRPQAALGPGQGARLGQELGPDGGRHGEHGREHPQVAGEPGGAGVAGGDGQGQGEGGQPSGGPGDHGGRPGARHPEQPAGEPGDGQDHRT